MRYPREGNLQLLAKTRDGMDVGPWACASEDPIF